MKLNRRNLVRAGVVAAGLQGVPTLAAGAAGQQKGAPVPSASQVATPAGGPILGKEATAATRAANAAVLRALDFDNVNQLAGIDAFADAACGFIATRPELVIAAEDGREVWDLTTYAFLDREEAPDTVNPSLWRQARLNMHHGLFEVVPGVSRCGASTSPT
jgi:alkyl sulfatase BDS1-like metallo-beta-lactamase superfamily hydrolase